MTKRSDKTITCTVCNDVLGLRQQDNPMPRIMSATSWKLGLYSHIVSFRFDTNFMSVLSPLVAEREFANYGKIRSNDYYDIEVQWDHTAKAFKLSWTSIVDEAFSYVVIKIPNFDKTPRGYVHHAFVHNSSNRHLNVVLTQFTGRHCKRVNIKTIPAPVDELV